MKPITPEELGINLKEDSPDLSDEEVAHAVGTIGSGDLIQKMVEFSKDMSPHETFKHELKRKNGVFYTRVHCGSRSKVYRIDWIKGESCE